MTKELCRLCQSTSELQHSHILPAFIFRWLKESSGNGHIRFGEEPNKRVQDGLKRYWLCQTCEDNFGKSETLFTQKLFYPYLKNSGDQFYYSRWLLHFCTSLSWRVLKFYIEEGHLKDWAAQDFKHINKAETTWREFLLEKRPHPGICQQHLLPLDRIESTTGKFASNINRYLMRAIDMDICKGGESIFTYAKLGRFIVLGFVHEPHLNHWKGTKVNANKGIIQPKKYVLPRAFGDYLNHKAQRTAALLNSISDKQSAKIDESFRKNANNYYGSDAMSAMLADLSMFGDDAFSKR